ncbi:MAG: peptide deformylase [Endomicrobium sp.]|nr:peptide deformylase [Endomicrobium sp.]
MDINGRKQHLKTDGFEAIALRREIDRLDGKVFLDRVTSLKTDVFRR